MMTYQNNDIPEVIAKAMSQPPSGVCLSIISYRNTHKVKALAYLPVYVKVYEDTFESLVNAIHGLNFVRKENWKQHNTLQAVFLSKVPKTLFSAFDQLINGDYFEALATCRIAYEILLRVCFIEVLPEHQVSTIKSEKGTLDFKPTNFLRDTLKIADKDPFYEFLSLPVHGHKYSVLKDIANGQQDNGLLLYLGFGYDEKDLQLAFNNLVVITYLAVRLFQGLFNSFLEGTEYFLKGEEPLETLIKDLPNTFNTMPVLINQILEKLKEG